jgi:hypothetical protein
MKERPILFSAEMVRAILEDRKGQTRRVIKPQPLKWCTRFELAPYKEGNFIVGEIGDWLQMTDDANSIRGLGRCPYGIPGDRLWVRETWALQKFMDDQLSEDGITPGAIDDQGYHIGYFADGSGIYEGANIGRKRPSIFMPRWASRINLLIKDIRVERVQEIGYLDCIAEGIEQWEGSRPGHKKSVWQLRSDYWRLWDSINAKRGYGWDVNPLVWVIEFEVMK